MRNLIYTLCALCSLALLSSCIENDLSVPTVVSDFVTFEVEGQKEVTIDPQTRTVAIVLDELADMTKVKLIGYTVSNDGTLLEPLPEYLDLSEPIEVTLHTYRDFAWTISATQPIERYIRCENQVGEAEIDPVRKVAYVYVTEDQSLSSVTISAMKLEPEGSVVRYTTGFISENGQSVPKTEPCDFPMVLDCVIMRYFMVEYHDEMIEWSVKVLQKTVQVDILSVNAWTYSAGVKGVTNGQGVPMFEYRRQSDAEWSLSEDVAVSGTSVSAEIQDLEEDTEYVVRLTNGSEISNEYVFRTGSADQIPNLGFDDWSEDDRYPNAVGSSVWDSANSSGATLTTTPSTDAVEGLAARLESVSTFGLLAAGNIFTGDFVKLAGLGAELDWGTPFTSRPIALRGYYKYSPVVVDKAKEPYMDMKGQMDQCQILMFLADWSKPFTVNTNEKKFVNLDNDPGIIALGQINTSEASDEYIRFTLPLVYRDNSRIPSYLVIAAASSRYGDYFTGGIGSVLFVDEFEFIYDPDELTAEEYSEVFSRVEPY
ncbi:MAG: PCMD domain-containing protein [Bacteroidales bacterium]|nr:PCMD domain-containing protein [Bacteroidales bacterium]